LDEGQGVGLLHEGDDVAALVAAEAVPQAQVGADLEGGGAFVVEGAQALHGVVPGLPERDAFGDDVLDGGPLTQGVDVLAADPAAPLLGHAVSSSTLACHWAFHSVTYCSSLSPPVGREVPRSS